jgi:hypothetical protein
MTLYYNDTELFITTSLNNINIKNSYKVRGRKNIKNVICMLKEKFPENNINKQSTFLLTQEWAVHNLCYKLNIFRDRTKDVDLNYPKKWYIKFIYSILGFLYF